MKKSNPLNRTTVDLGMLRILWVADRWSVFSSSFVVVQVGVSVSVKHNNKKSTKTGSSKELPMTKQGFLEVSLRNRGSSLLREGSVPSSPLLEC